MTSHCVYIFRPYERKQSNKTKKSTSCPYALTLRLHFDVASDLSDSSLTRLQTMRYSPHVISHFIIHGMRISSYPIYNREKRMYHFSSSTPLNTSYFTCPRLSKLVHIPASSNLNFHIFFYMYYLNNCLYIHEMPDLKERIHKRSFLVESSDISHAILLSVRLHVQSFMM